MRLNYENMTLDLVKIIDEGLVIVAQDGNIPEVNQGAADMLEFPSADPLKGQTISMLFPENQDISEILNARNRELNLLKRNGRTLSVLLHCSTIQVFYFYKPMPVAGIGALLEKEPLETDPVSGPVDLLNRDYNAVRHSNIIEE